MVGSRMAVAAAVAAFVDVSQDTCVVPYSYCNPNRMVTVGVVVVSLPLHSHLHHLDVIVANTVDSYDRVVAIVVASFDYGYCDDDDVDRLA